MNARVFHAKRPHRAATVTSRADWHGLLKLAGDCAEDVRADATDSDAQLRLMALSNRANGASSAVFANAGAATADAAKAFVMLARAFARSETAALTRRALEPVVAAGAAFLDAQLHRQATEEFERAHRGRPEVWGGVRGLALADLARFRRWAVRVQRHPCARMSVRNARATMADRREAVASLDYFPSPPWWGRALGDVLLQLGLPVAGLSCEEPAAGEGHLAHGLADVFGEVRAFDIHAYPRRQGAMPIAVRDYLRPDRVHGPAPDWTISNPPFGQLTTAFIRQAIARSRIGAAMLLQLRTLEGSGRYALFRECGLYATAVVPRRGSGLRKGLWQPGLSTATAYVWLIFVRPGVVPGWRGYDGEARQVWIAPDACVTFSRPSDMAFAGLGVPMARAA